MQKMIKYLTNNITIERMNDVGVDVLCMRLLEFICLIAHLSLHRRNESEDFFTIDFIFIH